MAKTPSVTIRDVARLSGVSIATVTRTFQGSSKVRPETRARVVAAAKQLGYRPDAAAQALATGASKTIGLMIPSLVDPYWGEVADAIEHSAAEQGYSVVLASSRGEPEREHAMLDILFGKRLDGIIVGGVAGDPDAWPESGHRRSPLVLMQWESTPRWDVLDELRGQPLTPRMWRLAEQRIGGRWSAHVSSDDVAGAAIVAEHLLELGHREIAFIASLPVRPCLLRLLGVRSTLRDAGLELRTVVVAEDTFEGGRSIAAGLLDGASRPTALICTSDVIAVGAMRAVHERNLDVPTDISVVGYDDIELAAYVDPPLTTLNNPKRQLGELALDFVLGALEDAQGPLQRSVVGSLTLRGSTAPPGAA
jgi:LacI family transcriptional regulator